MGRAFCCFRQKTWRQQEGRSALNGRHACSEGPFSEGGFHCAVVSYRLRTLGTLGTAKALDNPSKNDPSKGYSKRAPGETHMTPTSWGPRGQGVGLIPVSSS